MQERRESRGERFTLLQHRMRAHLSLNEIKGKDPVRVWLSH